MSKNTSAGHWYLSALSSTNNMSFMLSIVFLQYNTTKIPKVQQQIMFKIIPLSVFIVVSTKEAEAL